jgi:hypothetical protein
MIVAGLCWQTFASQKYSSTQYAERSNDFRWNRLRNRASPMAKMLCFSLVRYQDP